MVYFDIFISWCFKKKSFMNILKDFNLVHGSNYEMHLDAYSIEFTHYVFAHFTFE